MEGRGETVSSWKAHLYIFSFTPSDGVVFYHVEREGEKFLDIFFVVYLFIDVNAVVF
jgi:hypothetical protein